jgi:hypothetical protein
VLLASALLFPALFAAPASASIVAPSAAVATPAIANAPIATAPTPVPEPGTLLLVGSGLLGIAITTRRRRQKRELARSEGAVAPPPGVGSTQP